MLFPERLELEQDRNVHEAEEGNTDTASDGGLKRQQPDLIRTGSCSNSARPDGPEWMLRLSPRKGGSAPARTPSPHKSSRELPS